MDKNSLHRPPWPQGKTCQKIASLPLWDLANGLMAAVHIMERTLDCGTCPKEQECSQTLEECEMTVLSEVMEKASEGVSWWRNGQKRKEVGHEKGQG